MISSNASPGWTVRFLAKLIEVFLKSLPTGYWHQYHLLSRQFFSSSHLQSMLLRGIRRQQTSFFNTWSRQDNSDNTIYDSSDRIISTDCWTEPASTCAVRCLRKKQIIAQSHGSEAYIQQLIAAAQPFLHTKLINSSCFLIYVCCPSLPCIFISTLISSGTNDAWEDPSRLFREEAAYSRTRRCSYYFSDFKIN